MKYTHSVLVSFLLLPLLASAQDFAGQFPFQKSGRCIHFYYKHSSPEVDNLGRFCDAYVALVNRDFFNTDFDYPITAYVLEDKTQFQQFLTENFNVSNPPNYGIYLSKYKCFATYEGSGLGTFTHEILHPLIAQNLKNCPFWAIEGIPTFFEKFYGYWQNDQLIVYWGYQNPWRIQELGDNLTKLDLRKVVADEALDGRPVEQSESAWRMASVFLWQQNKFKRFLDLVAAGNTDGYPSYFEAAMQMSVDQIIPIWQQYLDAVAAHRAAILNLPVSQIFSSEQEFDDFVRSQHIPPPSTSGSQ